MLHIFLPSVHPAHFLSNDPCLGVGGGWMGRSGNQEDTEISRIGTRLTVTGIPSPHLTDMKKSRRRCTPEYDLRFSRYFGTSPGFWLRLQLDYDLMRAEREVQPHAA